MGDEGNQEDEDADGVDVGGELQHRELVAGQDSEEAIYSSDLVEDQGEGDDFGSGLKADEAK